MGSRFVDAVAMRKVASAVGNRNPQLLHRPSSLPYILIGSLVSGLTFNSNLGLCSREKSTLLSSVPHIPAIYNSLVVYIYQPSILVIPQPVTGHNTELQPSTFCPH
jgi:hypothetical protein